MNMSQKDFLKLNLSVRVHFFLLSSEVKSKVHFFYLSSEVKSKVHFFL